MHLLLVRHGITQHNLEGLYTGQKDIPLTELGRQQAEAVARYLAGEKLDVIISSDLQRARDTATAIAHYHNLPVLEDAELREVHVGRWESLSPAQIQELYGEEWVSVRSDPANYAPLYGETLLQLKERSARALRRYREQYEGKVVLWVTHGGFIGVLLCSALQLDLKYRRSFHIENTSVNEIHFAEGLPGIARLNDTAHLRSLLTLTQL